MIALGEIGKPAHARFKVTFCCRGESILRSYRDAAARLGVVLS